MSLVLICDYDCFHILPALTVGRDECDCCGTPAVTVTLEWLFWGIGLALHLD